MPAVLSVSIPGGVGSLSGQLQIADEGVTNLRRLYWPAGVNAIARHGTGYTYGNRNYLMGAWSADLMIDENFRVLRQGIIPPQSPPTVGVGGGATDQICYLSYYDFLTDERSSLSEGFSVTGNTTRAWSVLPTSVPGETAVIEGLVDIAGANITQSAGSVTNFSQIRPGDKVARVDDQTRWAIVRTITDDQTMTTDGSLVNTAGIGLVHLPISRVTHLELWVSVAGALPRLASRVPLGVTSWTESVGTLNLGEAFLDTFEPPVFGSITNTYADRQWWAGDPRNPDTLYGSALFQHERWEGLSFKTRYGEPITALIRTRDYLLVCCPSSMYVLTGYTEDDLTLRGDASDLGCMGPVTYFVVRNLAFIWNNQGIWLYNGSWHRMNTDNLTKYQDLYARFRREYETGICVYDPTWDCILFIPNYGDITVDYTGLTSLQQAEIVVWVLGDMASIGGAEAGGFTPPPESWDSPWVMPSADGTGGTAQIVSAAYLVPTGTSLGRFIKVGRGGEVCEETTSTAASSGMELWSSHSFLGTQGGDIEEGKTIKRVSAYYYGDYATCTWDVYAGSEYAQGDDIQRRPDEIAHSTTNVDINDLQTIHHLVIGAGLLEVLPPGPVTGGDGSSSLTWGVYEALTVHTWPEEIVGRGFTHRFRFAGRLVEFYGFGGYYGPGPVPRALTYATGTD